MKRRTYRGGGGSQPNWNIRKKGKTRSGLTLRIKVLTYEKIELCRHALDRMNRRSISRDEVIEAIDDPTSKGHKTKPGRTRVRKVFAATGKMIDVVYDEIEDRVRVITTFAR